MTSSSRTCRFAVPMLLLLITADPAVAQPAAAATQPAAAATQPATAAAPTASQPASAPAPIYDEKADARKQISAAIARAKAENQRVLIIWGANWCGWCRRLHDVFQADRDVARTLLYEYQRVYADVGHFDRQLDIAAAYNVDLKKEGLPFLTFLDADGKLLWNQETGTLEKGQEYDRERLLALLTKHKAEPRDAEKVLSEALAQAKQDDRRILLHVGAPWCPWCRQLDAFLTRPDVAPLLARDYLDVKIDQDRMTNAAAVIARLRRDTKGGIPWMVVLDADGQALVTSDGPQGNIGHPVTTTEIDYFIRMLNRTARRLSADDVSNIKKRLTELAAEIEAATSRPATAPG